MKTVVGEVSSSKPISLKKATSTLSTFVSTENGASPAVCAYLRRALASFKELRQHEKEFTGRRSERMPEKAKSEAVSDVSQASGHKRKKHRPESGVNGGSPPGRLEEPTRVVASGQETGHGVEDEVKKEKHRKNKEKGVSGKVVDNGGEVGESRDTETIVKIEPEENPGRRDEYNVGMESERKKHKKKIIPEEIKEEHKESGLADSYSLEPQSNKKKKKEKKKEKNDGGDSENDGIKPEDRDDRWKTGIKELNEESKKRKSEEVEENGVDGAEEQRTKKKKRRKTD